MTLPSFDSAIRIDDHVDGPVTSTGVFEDLRLQNGLRQIRILVVEILVSHCSGKESVAVGCIGPPLSVHIYRIRGPDSEKESRRGQTNR